MSSKTPKTITDRDGNVWQLVSEDRIGDGKQRYHHSRDLMLLTAEQIKAKYGSR